MRTVRLAAKGFTLIELLIAMTLGAIVLTAARAAFSTAVDTQRRVNRVATDMQTWRFFATRLRRDLQNLVISEGHGLHGGSDALSFVSDQGVDGLSAVQYRYTRTPAGAQLRRHVGEQEGVDTVVYEGARAVRFRYWRETSWQDRTTGALPGIISCRISSESGEHELLVPLELASHDQRDD